MTPRGIRQAVPGREKEDGYFRDRCVFGEGVTTETWWRAGAIRLRAVLSYQLTAFSPYEGNRIVFNGRSGRLEFTEVWGTEWLGQGVTGAGATVEKKVAPRSRSSRSSPLRIGSSGNRSAAATGGADTRIMADIFGTASSGR